VSDITHIPSSTLKTNLAKFWKIFRVIWVISGIVFTYWFFDSFNARGVEPLTLASNAYLEVIESEESIVFKPRQSNSDAGLLFFHGGGVEPIAYAPLIRAVAERGYLAVIIKLPYRFAPHDIHQYDAINRAKNFIKKNANINKWLVSGHSKGAKIASLFINANPKAADALMLIGTSHPKKINLSEVSIPVKKIIASHDGIATKEQVLKNKHLLPQDTRWIEIEGGNHSQFGNYGDQLFDGNATIDRKEQQRQTLLEIITTLKELNH
jgi:predicted alpha/beta-hydrolase family hydrolase